MEKWVNIEGFEEYYQLSTLGRIKSLRKNKILKLYKDNKGYIQTKLTINKKQTRRRLHRLVAEHFISNPDNLPEVNHKNGNKKDCSVDNLEWCTHLENIQHAHKTGLTTKKSPKAIQMLDKDGILIREFYSIHEAQRETGAEPTNIVKVCKGKRKTHNGYVWRYKDGN